jgi:hypothetical protein
MRTVLLLYETYTFLFVFSGALGGGGGVGFLSTLINFKHRSAGSKKVIGDVHARKKKKINNLSVLSPTMIFYFASIFVMRRLCQQLLLQFDSGIPRVSFLL